MSQYLNLDIFNYCITCVNPNTVHACSKIQTTSLDTTKTRKQTRYPEHICLTPAMLLKTCIPSVTFYYYPDHRLAQFDPAQILVSDAGFAMSAKGHAGVEVGTVPL